MAGQGLSGIAIASVSIISELSKPSDASHQVTYYTY
jgi:hypothetical protein